MWISAIEIFENVSTVETSNIKNYAKAQKQLSNASIIFYLIDHLIISSSDQLTSNNL